MSAVLQLVTVRPIERAEYDDTNLGNFELWQFDNAAKLAARWSQLGRALGLEDEDGKDDLYHWLKEQHTQRMRDRCGFMLPHGGSL